MTLQGWLPVRVKHVESFFCYVWQWTVCNPLCFLEVSSHQSFKKKPSQEQHMVLAKNEFYVEK